MINMNRRRFCGAVAGGLSGLTIFPRKSESAQSEGLSHEQMAQVILEPPHNVFLSGQARGFGKSRAYHYDSSGLRVEEWKDAVFGDQISCSHPLDSCRLVTSANGCVVESRFYDLDYDERYRLAYECFTDISNPLLKVIRLVERGGAVGMPSRHFARLEEKWVEL